MMPRTILIRIVQAMRNATPANGERWIDPLLHVVAGSGCHFVEDSGKTARFDVTQPCVSLGQQPFVLAPRLRIAVFCEHGGFCIDFVVEDQDSQSLEALSSHKSCSYFKVQVVASRAFLTDGRRRVTMENRVVRKRSHMMI
jgi:hypothetical protein